jgi:hypothetical protein
MYVAMHFAAAAQVLLRFRVQGSGVKDQSFRRENYGIDLTLTPETLHCIRNAEPEISKAIAGPAKLTPDP